jgi:phosphopantetheine--protein transferase-like protein
MMTISCGIDTVQVQRFQSFCTYRAVCLQRAFSHDEIAYCVGYPRKSAERFAARFAVKEAFYKALCQLLPDRRFAFFRTCQCCQIIDGAPPKLKVDWQALGLKEVFDDYPQVCFSLSHTTDHAVALVLLQKI